MWMINNQTSFATERAWVRDKNGAEVWLVAIKGTFDILADGTTQLANKQEDVVLAPRFRGDPHTSSLLSDTDLPHKKVATDVLLDGHAYAPAGKKVTRTSVGLEVGSIKKILRVTGDRYWRSSVFGVTASDPKPFTKMPLIYERAYGGMDMESNDKTQHTWDIRNPAGCGFATQDKHLIGKPLPNVEDPKSLLKNIPEEKDPVGFGPIAGHWAPRVRLAGTYDEHWENTRQPLLPDDFNEQYHQCAPADQQVPGFLKGGEKVTTMNVVQGGGLQFRLPRISIGLITKFSDHPLEVHRPVLHTVIIKPDRSKLVMVWHSHLECHHKVLKLSSTTVRIKQRI